MSGTVNPMIAAMLAQRAGAQTAPMAQGAVPGPLPQQPVPVPQGAPTVPPQAAPQPVMPQPSTVPMAPPGAFPGGAPADAGNSLGRNVSLLAQADQNFCGGRGGNASKGRFGDTMMAHVTPGEIAVPPQVQTPQLLAAITQAFRQAGVSPEQFTAGSRSASVNPRTGQQEFSIWGSILPALLGTVGAVVAPELLPAAGALAAPLGGALGGGVGSAIGGGSGTQDLFSALGGALGAGAGGAMSSGASAATNAAANAATQNAAQDASMASIAPVSASSLSAAASPLSSGSAFFNAMLSKPALGAGMGASLGSSFAPSNAPTAANPTLSSGFNNPMNPLNRNWGALIGSGAQPTPTFSGYNPIASVSGQPFTFYPGA